jgi:hypothetical protein
VLAGALVSTGGLVPNDVVPRPVLNATCEFARGLLVADLTKDPVGEGLNSFRMEGAFTMAFRPGFLPPMLPRVVRDFLGRLGQPVQSGGASLKLTRT